MRTGFFDKKQRRGVTASLANTLIADFQTSQIILQAIASANYRASQSESDTLIKFSSFRRQGEAYVKPQDLPLDEDKSLTHASLDSHLQKVQSEQIQQRGLQTIHELELSANAAYDNKKISIKVIDNSANPIHNQWLDQASGQFYYGSNHSRSISGKVSEINLSDNYIALKPSTGRQLVNKLLKAYVIEVINPSTGQPLISAEIDES